MPCNYKKYPANWFTVIRPAILDRDEHRCAFCGVENKRIIFRGFYKDIEVYQHQDGSIYRADNGEPMGDNHFTDIEPSTGKEEQLAIKVILTIAHLDHDITNNDYSNLRALCQQCHLRYDAKHHQRTRKYGNNTATDLFNEVK